MALIHEPVVAGVVVFFGGGGIQRDMPHVHLTPTLSCVSIPSVMHEECFASIMEHCGAYAPLLHALVEYHIPTTLPMKQLHAGTGAVQENIHTSIDKTKGVTANKNAEGIHDFTKVNGAREQQESVTFI